MFERRDILKGVSAAAATSAMPATLQANPCESLAQIARSRGIKFGCAVSQNVLQDADYRRLVLHHSNRLVGENAFKWRHLEPAERDHSDSEARWLVDFAQTHGRDLRGHCFLWNHHRRMPSWLVEKAAVLDRSDPQEFTRHLWRHGAFLARNFPEIDCWDAMNEAINPSTGELRDTHFTWLLGNRFFDLAFRILGERMPGARLVYNETMSWEQNSLHRDGVLRLLERGLSRGLPIHALGIQSHIGKTLGRPRDELAWRRFLEEVEGMGLQVLITEFDCSDRNVDQRDTDWRDGEVAAHSKGYLDLTLSFTNVRELTLWSLADRHSYMNRPSYPSHRRRSDGLRLRGHPFGDDLERKPVFFALLEALKATSTR